MSKRPTFGVVLSGGGARGAYEAGVLTYLHEKILSKKSTIKNFDIYCGSSVGAINTCYLVSSAFLAPEERADKLFRTWKDLKQDEIYVRNLSGFTGFLVNALKGISLNFFRSPKKGPTKPNQHFNGFFDTKPLPKFIGKHIDFIELNRAVSKGPIQAVTLTATNMMTDSMELFVHKKRTVAYTGPYPVNETMIDVEHAMASGAIPIAFPPVKVGKHFYMDGGLRLNTPLSPAIQFGADRIFIVGLHSASERRHVYQSDAEPDYAPTLGDILGKVLNSIFLDRIEYDLEQLHRINRISEWGRMCYGDNFVSEINKMLAQKKIRGDIANRGLKDLKVCSIFPSRDLREVFGACLAEPHAYSKHFGSFEKLLLRVLDVDLIQGRDFLSYLMFMPNYLGKLLELGYADARTKEAEITEFLKRE